MQQSYAGVFPSITAEALDKTEIKLPEQLEGKENLLLLSWARNQAPQVETWTAVAQAVQHTYADVKVYWMPVSDPENGLYRWWDNASMRSAVDDPDMLHWTVPLYTNRRALRVALQVPTNSHAILALLVDRTGRVLWVAEGPSTASSRAALQAAVRARHAERR